jgi:hypothetical protein
MKAPTTARVGAVIGAVALAVVLLHLEAPVIGSAGPPGRGARTAQERPRPSFRPLTPGIIVDTALVAPSLRQRPVATQPEPEAGQSVSGGASWYCKAGVSVCHYRYPPGSMVAAACGKLRRAMGSDWRGRTVTVTRRSTGKSVSVRLVDWCGSTDKLIDLYWRPMDLLGGSGVIGVTVRW